MSSLNLSLLKQFFEKQYSRNLVFKTENVEIVLMCWLPGQGTIKHGHGQSDAITFIIDGEMSCVTYNKDNSKTSTILSKGDIELIPVGVEHEVRNNSNSNLVTLHVYSPPLSMEEENLTFGYNNDTKSEFLQLDNQTMSYLMGCVPEDILRFFTNQEKRRQTIAIIGGGFSGSLVATQLMKEYAEQQALQVVLIERSSRFARGFAYSTNSPMHFLNVPAGNMSAFNDDPDHFLRWIQKRDPSVQSNTFVSRMLYGEYLESVLYEADHKKSHNVKFKRINDEAISLSIDDSDKKACIYLESGINVKADLVVLAVGNYPPKNPRVQEPSFYSSDKYVKDPWSSNSLHGLNNEENVLLIGTGLTMIDKTIELNYKKHRGKIYALSRHGLIPQKHNLKSGTTKLEYDSLTQFTNLRDLLKFVRSQIKLFVSLGGDWRAYMDGLRPHLQKLWATLSERDKKQFFRHLRPYWDTHRHRIPEHSAVVIDTMLNYGQLEVMAGRILDFQELDNNLVRVKYRERGSNNTKNLIVGKVINCTGSELDFCQIEDPLIVNLLDQGLIKPDALALGLEANGEGALLNGEGMVSDYLFTLGAPLKGQLWETTAVPEIRLQAENLAKLLVDKQQPALVNVDS